MDNTLNLILLQYKQGRSFEDTKQSLLDLFGERCFTLSDMEEAYKTGAFKNGADSVDITTFNEWIDNYR